MPKPPMRPRLTRWRGGGGGLISSTSMVARNTTRKGAGTGLSRAARSGLERGKPCRASHFRRSGAAASRCRGHTTDLATGFPAGVFTVSFEQSGRSRSAPARASEAVRTEGPDSSEPWNRAGGAPRAARSANADRTTRHGRAVRMLLVGAPLALVIGLAGALWPSASIDAPRWVRQEHGAPARKHRMAPPLPPAVDAAETPQIADAAGG